METTIGFCGHSGMVVTSSPNVNANTRGKTRIGENVIGCNIGTVITGNPTHNVN